MIIFKMNESNMDLIETLTNQIIWNAKQGGRPSASYTALDKPHSFAFKMIFKSRNSFYSPEPGWTEAAGEALSIG